MSPQQKQEKIPLPVDCAFSGCSSLISLTIPDSVTNIGISAFSGCSSLTSITVDENNKSYASQDGILYNKAKTQFIHIPNAIKGAITIPDSVTSIGQKEFYNCSNLTSITIPDNVTSIGESAFENCRALTIYCETTEKPSGWHNSWNWKDRPCPVIWDCKNTDKDANGYSYIVINGIRYSIKDGVATVIEQPSDIFSVNVPSIITYKDVTYKVSSIGENAFYECCSLTSITISNSVTSIGDYAFYRCNSLTGIIIPDSVTNMGDYVFYGCSSLTGITIPGSIKHLYIGVFMRCNSLTSIIFNGTKAQWHKIYSSWNKVDIDNCTVHCTDGDIVKGT